MIIDNFGQQIYNEQDLCEIFLKNPYAQLHNIIVDKQINFDNILDLGNIPKLITYTKDDRTLEKFDSDNQSKWLMPDEYKSMDIAKYVLDLCKNETELQRAGEELLKFQDRNMFDLLKFLKYLVDTMKQNNIVWGVGRGSSVSSYVLFLLGVHRINSLYYDLSIDEFLK